MVQNLVDRQLLIEEKVSQWNEQLRLARETEPDYQPDLSDVDLCGKNLREVDLSNCKLTRAQLVETDLTDADLAKSNLTDACLRLATLHRTNFKRCTGLLETMFPGADLRHCDLPSRFEFAGLKHIEETTKSAKVLLLFLIAGSLFGLVSAIAIKDRDFLMEAQQQTLPFLQASVPLTIFAICTPLAIFVLSIYLHLYLQHLWRELSQQPAIYPDGKTLDRHAHPWLINALYPHYSEKIPPASIGYFEKLRFWSAFTLTWLIPPIVLTNLWLVSLKAQSYAICIYLIAITTASVTFTVASMIFATHHMRNKSGKYSAMTWVLPASLCGTITLLLLSALSFLILSGDKQSWWPYLKLAREELSQKHKDDKWSQPFDELEKRMRPVNLSGRRLRYIDASRANLTAVDLTGANLEGAILERSDLWHATVAREDSWRTKDSGFTFSAEMRGVRLNGANLENARLIDVDLSGSDFAGANLEMAILDGSNLQNVRNFLTSSTRREVPQSMLYVELKGTLIDGWDLSGILMDHANLAGARSTLEVVRMVRSKLNHADLSDVVFVGNNVQLDHIELNHASLIGARIESAIMKNAWMDSTDCTGANFSGTDFSGAKMDKTVMIRAFLDEAIFKGARLSKVDMTGACLHGTDFQGVDLSTVIGLEKSQLKNAILDENTILPDYLSKTSK